MRPAALLLVLLLVPVSHAIVINEIMYDPAGNDANNEWVELYNDEGVSYNITNITIGDLNSNDTLTKLQGSDMLSAGGFMLIGESGINLSLFPGAIVFSAGATIGNGLANAADTVFLYRNNSIVDNISYSSSQGGSNNGKTLCRFAGQIKECHASPAASNIAANQDAKLEVVLSTININRNYTSLFRIDIDNKDCAVADNVTVSYNITNATELIKQGIFTRSIGCTSSDGTGEWMPNKAGNFIICGIITNTTSGDAVASNNIACQNVTVDAADGCNVGVLVESDAVITAGSAMSYRIVANDTSCSNVSHKILVSYWIEDLFGNVDRNETTEQNMTCYLSIPRQWTPEGIAGSDAWMINAKITNTYCNDSDSSNNFNSKLLVVKGSALAKESSIIITNVDVGSDNLAKYGETVGVTVGIYRNNTAKYAIDAWVKNATGTRLSEISTVHVASKLTAYTFKIPVQLKPNCDSALPDGSHMIVVEGLDKTATAAVSISGISDSTCKTVTVSTSTSGGGGSGGSSAGGSGNTTSLPYEILSQPDFLHVSERFYVQVKIINNDNFEKNFSAYSYVYRDNKPVSLGLSNEVWSAEWTANMKKLKLGPKSSSIVNLESKIEDTTEPGKYKLNVRIKEGEKERDFTKDIEILPAAAKPNLTVKTAGTDVNLESGCTECSFWILPEDVMLNGSSASLNVSRGRHYITLLRQNEVIDKLGIDIAEEAVANQTGNVTFSTGGNLITAFLTRINPIPFNLTLGSRLLAVALLKKMHAAETARNAPSAVPHSTSSNSTGAV